MMVTAGNRHSVKLWHFTCGHGRRLIGKRGILQPHPHPALPSLGPVVWLTADPSPDRDDVGLTSRILSCDRMEYRYRAADSATAVPWSSIAALVDPEIRADLEGYAKPDTWWISYTPVQAVLS